ncbi:MAG: tetratricopeptide repeat protein [Bacteroidia bacterium]|nr:tetratricopeptide repeat protein [Bacteroidia bacterium]
MNIRIEINDTSQLRNSYNNIGNTYMSMDNYEKGLEFYNKAKEIYYRSGDRGSIEMINLNLGDVYLKMGLKEKNKAYLNKSLEIFLDVLKNFNDENVNNRYAISLARVGQIYLEMGNLPLALDYLQKGHEVSVFIQDKSAELNATEHLSRAYEKMGDYRRANYLLHRFNELKDSLVNQKNGESIEQMQTVYKTAEKDREIQNLNNEKALKDAEIARNRSMIFAAVTAFVLVLFVVLVVLSRYNLKKKANLKLSEAYQKIEIKNKQITDSINYSKRIQNAILPPHATVAKHLKNFFVLNTPKDIVSGDFYWFTAHNNNIFFIVADCTGHGVPGALMSMIGNTLLNEIINQKDVTEPGEILAQLNKGVMNALRQGANELVSQEDGMDVSIVSFNIKNPTLIKYACANHSIFVKSKNKVNELTGDIYSIGGDFSKLEKTFETREYKVAEGDYIIMSSDGYYDQFGGNNDSKYLISRFEELILKTDFDKQNPADVFNIEIANWKGNTKQTDDILVAGFKV